MFSLFNFIYLMYLSNEKFWIFISQRGMFFTLAMPWYHVIIIMVKEDSDVGKYDGE